MYSGGVGGEKNAKDAGRSGRIKFRLAVSVGALTTLTVFLFYLATLAPTVLYYDRPILLDSAMLQTQAAVLGIPGGTGVPSWVMLTHLFTYLPFGDPAYRVNLASAVYASGTVAFIFASGYLLGRNAIAAAAGALAFGFGTTLWSQAVIAEVYTLNALFISSSLFVLLMWSRTRRDGYLLLGCFLMGLSLTNHITSGLMLAGSFLLVLIVDWRKFLEWRLVLKGSGLFAVGLLPYLYLPIRAAMNPPLNEWNPTNFERFWYLVSGGDHHINSFAFGPSQVPERFSLYLDFLFENFHWGVVLVAAVGAVMLVARRESRAVGITLIALWTGWMFHAIEYNIFDFNLYFITSYVIVALAFSYGVAGLIRAVAVALQSAPRAASLAAVCLLAAGFVLLSGLKMPEAYAANDMSEDYRGREVIEAVVEGAQPNSVVLHHRSSLWYMVLVEKRRTDLSLADPLPPGRERYTDIVWPDDIDHVTTNLRYGTNDETGVSTARIYAREGPVYILNEDAAFPRNFTDAGFEIVHVKDDILYELIPPEEDGFEEDEVAVSE